MSDPVEVHGVCPPQFAPVRDAFAANFAEAEEVGAGFAVALGGEVVVDIWAGWTSRKRDGAWAQDSIVPIHSSTKAMTSLVIAKAAGEGRIDYAAPVISLWPEFGAAGKDRLTVEQVLSHQAGLPGFEAPIDPELWFDWHGLCARLAETAPMWPPGTASGYHPQTWGYLAGEIFRRATGRTVGRALREDFAEPFGLDVWLGLPEAHAGRAVEMIKPRGPAMIGELNPYKKAAFYTSWAAPPGRGSEEWRRMELPAANGHATASALARLMSIAACDGRIDDRQAVNPGAMALASRERIRGQDLVLPFVVSWAAGFMRNTPDGCYGPNPDAFGHSGWGGSCVVADPDRQLSLAYVMNRQSTYLVADPRAVRLIEAVYASL